MALTVGAMYIRFVTTRIDQDSHQPQGVFTASYALLDSGDLGPDEWKRLREMLDWFNENLPHPPTYFTAGRAVFWFKPSALESIRNIWGLVHMLRQYGHYVEIQKRRRLGNVFYEDRLQVAAFPSKSDAR